MLRFKRDIHAAAARARGPVNQGASTTQTLIEPTSPPRSEHAEVSIVIACATRTWLIAGAPSWRKGRQQKPRRAPWPLVSKRRAVRQRAGTGLDGGPVAAPT